MGNVFKIIVSTDVGQEVEGGQEVWIFWDVPFAFDKSGQIMVTSLQMILCEAYLS